MRPKIWRRNMKDGFLKAAAATPEVRVADCSWNAARILELAADAERLGVRLLVFPELSVTGYTCGDLFGQRILLEGARSALREIRDGAKGFPGILAVGLPLDVGQKVYNCCAVLCGGTVLGVIPKISLPNYGEFYEARNFAPAPPENRTVRLFGEEVPFGTKLLSECRQMPQFRLGAEICEDLWVPARPSIRLAEAGATVIANLSASDETAGKADYRRRLVQGQSARLVCGYLYSDAGEGESMTDLVFSGHCIAAEDGVILAETPPFSDKRLAVADFDLQRIEQERRRMNTYPSGSSDEFLRIPFDLAEAETPITRSVEPLPFVPSDPATLHDRCEEILTIQSRGLTKRLSHTGAEKAVLGLSGGLDSTLALLVAARALDRLGRPRSDLLTVTMPCFGTTSRTRRNGERLARLMGAQLREIDLSESVLLHFRDLGHPFERQDAAFENAQARERTQLLMDLANETNGLVVGTGDLSELALGWATYNGDHMSMYGVNASIPKTLVRQLVCYAAESSESDDLRAVLLDILDTPVSPELLPAKEGKIVQKTESIVGPYEVHDFCLYYTVRWGFSPRKVFRLARAAFGGAYSSAELIGWMKTFYRRFFSQQFKRSCLPDGPKVGSVTLSPRGDWKMPSDAAPSLWLRELDELEAALRD